MMIFRLFDHFSVIFLVKPCSDCQLKFIRMEPNMLPSSCQPFQFVELCNFYRKRNYITKNFSIAAGIGTRLRLLAIVSQFTNDFELSVFGAAFLSTSSTACQRNLCVQKSCLCSVSDLRACTRTESSDWIQRALRDASHLWRLRLLHDNWWLKVILLTFA